MYLYINMEIFSKNNILMLSESPSGRGESLGTAHIGLKEF